MVIFVSDLFKEFYSGGAELTTDAIISDSLLPSNKILSSFVNFKTIQENKDKFWIFSNFTGLSDDSLFYIAKNIKYATLEYDYKFCKHRSPRLHKHIEGKECNCFKSKRAKVVSIFLKHAQATFWMSHEQKSYYEKTFPFLKKHNNVVLSSVFSKESLKFFRDYHQNPNKKEKNDKYLILGSSSWIKGVPDCIAYAKKNGLKYEILSGLTHEQCLKKLEDSKGLIFLPKGRDTCPRLVIEAKILGCDIHLNDYVQHKDEEWFETTEKIIDYLEERTQVFWKEASKHIPELPKAKTDEKTHFKIVVPFYNAGKWIEKCINSIKIQDYKNFKCYLVDDISTDKSAANAEKLIAGDDRFKLVKNKEKKYALKNINDTIIASEARQQDVIILLDGDDWLSGPSVLSKLDEVYEDPDCWLTYGSYIMHPYGIRGTEPSEYPLEVIKNNGFREDKWRASHLRTFKHFLWEKINKNDLKYESGDFFEMTYDQAIMLPLLEMSGERIRYIDHIMHVYNKENPLNIDKNKAKKQYELSLAIRKKKKYKKI
jgi:hypothetical protein